MEDKAIELVIGGGSQPMTPNKTKKHDVCYYCKKQFTLAEMRVGKRSRNMVAFDLTVCHKCSDRLIYKNETHARDKRRFISWK